MNRDLALEWLRGVNPITYRKMAQRFAKYLKWMVVDNSQTCPAGNYTKDDIEKTLDMYGLLLFKTYNENGDGDTPSGTDYNLTQVNSINRKRSEMIAKNLLKKDTRTEYVTMTIFDSQSDMRSVINGTNLLVSLSNLTDPDLAYNNGNSKVSPGEVVGVYINLYNNSNSIIANPRLLATDWSHMKNDKPCSDLSDNFPSIDQGGVVCDDPDDPNDGLTKDNFDDDDKRHPVCMIEYNDGTSTQLLSQREYFKKMKLETGIRETDCLDSDNTKTCFIRALPGLDVASYSQINPRSNWLETIKNEDGSADFKPGNIIFFEVNKNLRLGTNIICRLRTTFTNCDDCYHNPDHAMGDDFEDWEYSGERPFNIINLLLQVQD
jgi:hypothetical protein